MNDQGENEDNLTECKMSTELRDPYSCTAKKKIKKPANVYDVKPRNNTHMHLDCVYKKRVESC